MPVGIPIPFQQLPKTLQSLGQFQKSDGLAGWNTDASQAVASAGLSTKIDARGIAVSQEQAGQAIGGAVQGLGKLGFELKEKQNQAINVRKGFEAEEAMAKAQGEIGAKLAAEPDEAKWTGIVNDHTEKLRGQLLTPDLSPDAADAITHRFGMWSAQQFSATQINSAQKSAEKLVDAAHAQIIQAVDAGDLVRAKQLADGLHSAGYISDTAHLEMIDRGKARYEQNKRTSEAKAVDTAQNEAVGMAAGSGEAAALKALDDGRFGEHDPVTKEKLRNSIQAVGRDRSAEALNKLSEGIITDKIDLGDGLLYPASDKSIDAINSPHLTPKMREKAKGWLAKFDGEKAKAIRNGPEGINNYASAYQDALNWAPDKKDEAAWSQLGTKLRDVRAYVPEDLQGEVTKILHEKFNAKPPEPKSGDPAKDYIADMFKQMFDPEKGLVPYQTKEMKDGETVVTEDPTKRATATKTMAILRQGMENFIKLNPTKKDDIPAIEAEMRRLKPEGVQASKVDILMQKFFKSVVSVVGKVTSYGYTDDPHADSKSSAGVGAFVPAEEEKKIRLGQPSDHKLRDGDIAVSPDIEEQFKAAGVKPRGKVLVTLKNGETRLVRWADRTAQDADIKAGKVKGVTEPLRGRFDFYSSNGKHPLDGIPVASWAVPKE